MRLLIYGFGPYRQFQDNVAEKLSAGCRDTAGAKLVFPVRVSQGAVSQRHQTAQTRCHSRPTDSAPMDNACGLRPRRQTEGEIVQMGKRDSDSCGWTSKPQDQSQIGSRTAREIFQQGRGVCLQLLDVCHSRFHKATPASYPGLASFTSPTAMTAREGDSACGKRPLARWKRLLEFFRLHLLRAQGIIAAKLVKLAAPCL